ncbi:MAG TPA: rhodanese-like domain-containing protein, partial [Aquaticitalea sp.]|nr:rhodanese-like domain-containing protein [Aquaticitalea sp.]
TILIVADDGREEEVVTRLARVGYDNTIGFLKGGFDAWKNSGKETDNVVSISADKLAERMEKDPNLNILDVRKKSEYYSEHIIGAENVPLDYINEHIAEVSKDKTYCVHCAAGYRSMAFISILKARGYENLIDVNDGFNGVKKSEKFNLTDYVCPTTML